MPLHQPYKALLNSPVADINNLAEGYGGAVTAALFLEHFVEQAKAWIHIDVMAWNLADKPGRPAGGEAMGLRAIAALIDEIATR
jgi:leucyl aminopeptidase